MSRRYRRVRIVQRILFFLVGIQIVCCRLQQQFNCFSDNKKSAWQSPIFELPKVFIRKLFSNLKFQFTSWSSHITDDLRDKLYYSRSTHSKVRVWLPQAYFKGSVWRLHLIWFLLLWKFRSTFTTPTTLEIPPLWIPKHFSCYWPKFSHHNPPDAFQRIIESRSYLFEAFYSLPGLLSLLWSKNMKIYQKTLFHPPSRLLSPLCHVKTMDFKSFGERRRRGFDSKVITVVWMEKTFSASFHSEAHKDTFAHLWHWNGKLETIS